MAVTPQDGSGYTEENCTRHRLLRNLIGDSLAQEFARRSHRVLATARSLSKTRYLQSMGMVTFELDVVSSDSIAKFCRKVVHIDILINNGRISVASTLSDISISEFKKQFEVNVFDTFELTQALIPLLVKSRGIMVNHTSQAPYGISVGNGAYAASKSALLRLSDTWRIELAPFGIRIVELVTEFATSNILVELEGGRQDTTNSIYMPIEAEINKAMSGESIIDKAMPNDVYAKKVVGDLLDGWWGPPVWIWGGSGAAILYYVWFLGCHWKDLFGSLLGRILNLHLLARETARTGREAEKGQLNVTLDS